MRYVNAILGSLRSAGFSVEDAAHAFWLLDSYCTARDPRASVSSRPDEASVLERPRWRYPHLVEIAEDAARSTYSVDREFEFGSSSSWGRWTDVLSLGGTGRVDAS